MKKSFLLFSSIVCFVLVLQAQKVGINVTAPSENLHVDSTIKVGKNVTLGTLGRKNLVKFGDDSYVTIGEEVTDDRMYIRYGDLVFFPSGGSGSGRIGIKTETPSADLDVNGTVRLRVAGAAAGNILTSDANGNATWQTPISSGGTNVGFNAELALDVPLSNTSYNPTSFTENFEDGGNNFNTSTGQFTAPSAGVYHFVANVGWGSTTGGNVNYYQTRILLNRGGSIYIISQTGQPYTAIAGYGVNFSASVIYKLQAGDKVYLEVSHTGSATINLSSNGSSATTFSGAKLY